MLILTMTGRCFTAEWLTASCCTYLDCLKDIALGGRLCSRLVCSTSSMLLNHRRCQNLGNLWSSLRVDLQELPHEVDQICTVLAGSDGLVPACHDLGSQLCHGPGLKWHSTRQAQQHSNAGCASLHCLCATKSHSCAMDARMALSNFALAALLQGVNSGHEFPALPVPKQVTCHMLV